MSYLTQYDISGVIVPIQQITTSSGIVTPAAGNVNLVGGNVVTTSGVGDTATVELTQGTNGQVIIGATGLDPAWASITSSDASITITPGANTLDITTTGVTGPVSSTDNAIVRWDGATGKIIQDSGVIIDDTDNVTGVATLDVVTSITCPKYQTDVATDLVINMADDIGGNVVSFTNDSDAQVAEINSIGEATFTTMTASTSVVSPLYTVAAGDIVLNMTDAAGANSVSFTNNVSAEVAYVDSLGAALFTQLDVDNININGNVISSTDVNGDITLTPNGTGRVNISYLTQYTLPIAGATGEIDDLADGLGTLGQVLTSNGAGAEPTWEDASGGGITWNEETGTSATMVVDNGYIANNVALVTLTLPDTAAVGSVVRVAGKGAGGWRIAQNAGETIHFGSQSTTTGITGYLEFTVQYDAVELVCITANTDWVVISSVGNLTIN